MEPTLSQVNKSTELNLMLNPNNLNNLNRPNNYIPIALLTHIDVLQMNILDEFDGDLAVTYISVESR